MNSILPFSRQLRSELVPARLRTHRQWAEEEVILPPGGPRAGFRFRVSYNPFAGVVLDLLDTWRRFFGSGPIQCGKTTLLTSMPLLYRLCELRQHGILGAPTVEMAQRIWALKILPILEATRYADILPARGPGSLGGSSLRIEFRNGAVLHFVGGSGGDSQRSEITAEFCYLTEIDKMDTARSGSRETSPLGQFEGRIEAHGDAGAFGGECTVSHEEGAVWQEITEDGTDTRLFLRCPLCGIYQYPERDQLIGWQEATTPSEARALARLVCSGCGGEWEEKERRKAQMDLLPVHRGQAVRDGRVVGEVPATRTLGVRWSWVHVNPEMVPMQRVAEEEWKRSQRVDEAGENLEKRLCQYRWTIPYRGVDLKTTLSADAEMVLGKRTDRPRGEVPEGATLTGFIDVHARHLTWAIWAWLPGAMGYQVDRGDERIPQGERVEPLAILEALRLLRDGKVARYGPGLMLVDSAWSTDIVYRFILESGQGQWLAYKGHGTAKNQPKWRKRKAGRGVKIGKDWALVNQRGGIQLLEANSDAWKTRVHEGFAAPHEVPGSLHLFRGTRRDHLEFAGHVTAERREEEFLPGRGVVVTWKQIRAANHHLDTTYGSRVAADVVGITLVEEEREPVRRTSWKARRRDRRNTRRRT